MDKVYAVPEPNDRKFNVKDFIGKTIRESEIYTHFTNENTRNQKLVIYVNSIIPINQKIRDWQEPINPSYHCVVATGIKKWKEVECLVLDNTGGKEALNYIPVDFPFFEEVLIKTNQKKNDVKGLNDYGLSLAKIKWKHLKKKTNGVDWFNIQNEDGDDEYKMFFVKGDKPIFKIEFVSS